ncbi:MAG TPA: hypothetical protein VEL07_15125 [Planctomycetota bacterium]|nr:hypothetical protein [Planctomycetota bacterium]
MKTILITTVLALMATSASALETALTLASGPNTITIDPGLGTISLYYVQDGRLNKRPGTANFLTDLNVYRKTIIRMEKGGEESRPMSALEIGSANNIPTPDQLMTKLAEAEARPRKQDKDAPPHIPLPVRAANTEAEFWSKIWDKEEAYDGVISAALGNRYLIVVVPAVRCFLVYEVVGEQIEPRGWRNYGVDLYVPTVWNSTPLPQEIFDQLPKDVKEEHGEALKEQLEAMSTDQAKVIATKDSEVWIVAGGAGPASDRWVLVDIANTRVLSYHFPGKGIELRSVRNMEVDLLIPSSYNSTPDQRQLFQEFTRDKARKAFVETLGIVQFDLAELRAIVGQRQVKAAKNVSPVQAAVAPGSSTLDVIIDFTQQQKILTYRAVGQGNGLEFMAMRDYTLDSALASLDNMRMEKAYAKELLGSAKRSLDNHRVDLAWLTAKTALKMDPALYAQIEKNTDMHKQFAKLPDYAQSIQDATAAAKKEQERAEARAKKAQEEREKKKGGGDK